MKNIELILIVVLVTACFVNRSLYYTHMFQLNSYRYERFFRFLKANREKIWPPSQLVYVIGLWISVNRQINALIILLLAIGFMYLMRKKEKKKKPLVYTARVRRLLCVHMMLFVIGVGTSYVIGDVFFSVLFAFLSMPMMLLANVLLTPWEKMQKKYYYNDAKKCLEAHPTLKIIGVTGSYGKTSTKFILEKILSKNFNTLVTPQSYNTPLGVIITIRQQLRRTHEIFIVEMGAKQKGDIDEICQLVHPLHGIITAVGPQHLETFGDVDTVIDTKFELAQHIGKKGFCYVNGDDDNVKKGMERYSDVHYVTYGQEDAYGMARHVQASNIRQSVNGLEFTLHIHGKDYSFSTKLLGAHNMQNIAGAVAIAFDLDVPYEKIRGAVQELKPVEHRLELKTMQGGYYILDDAFNSNAVGAKSALDVLAQFESGRRVIMTPGMIELGVEDDPIHQNFGRQIADVCDDVILIGEKKTASIVKGLKAKNYPMEHIHICSSVYEGFNKIQEIIQPNDIVLIENDLPDNFNE